MNAATRELIKMLEEGKTKSGQSFMELLREARERDVAEGIDKPLGEQIRNGIVMRALTTVMLTNCPVCDVAVNYFVQVVEWDLVAQAVIGVDRN